jgi:rhamnogalacturonan endolyase
VFLQNDVEIKLNLETQLRELKWPTQGRKPIWQIGTVDRRGSEFKLSGAPHKHAKATECPANATFTIGESKTGDWCFAQGEVGTWTVRFQIPQLSKPTGSSAVLSVSLAGFSSVTSSEITVNNSTIGSFSKLKWKPDSSLPRSGTVAGEWKYAEFPIRSGILKEGWNTIDFTIRENTLWRGYIFDSILLEWA